MRHGSQYKVQNTGKDTVLARKQWSVGQQFSQNTANRPHVNWCYFS